jgi:DNA-binding MarR family transcriptional regulator
MTDKKEVTADGASLDQDTGDVYDALSDLIKLYQFRDRNRVHCHGISVTECYALEVVDRHGPLTLNEVASHLFLEKSTVSRVVDVLERKGFVWRTPHPEDRRAVQIGATAEGQCLHRRIANEAKDRYRALVAEIEPEARSTVIGLLRRLSRLARTGATGDSCGTQCVTEAKEDTNNGGSK